MNYHNPVRSATYKYPAFILKLIKGGTCYYVTSFFGKNKAYNIRTDIQITTLHSFYSTAPMLGVENNEKPFFKI